MPYLHLLSDPGMNYTQSAIARWHVVTARISTAREGGEQHCQVGNSALARDEIVRWLARFYPDIAATEHGIER